MQDDDFQFSETTVQFPMYASPSLAADTTDVNLTITIVADDIHEERECFTCTIHNSLVPEKELRCPPQTTTICIVDPGEYTVFQLVNMRMIVCYLLCKLFSALYNVLYYYITISCIPSVSIWCIVLRMMDP